MNPFQKNPQYPNRLPETMEEYRPLPCAECGCERRLVRGFQELKHHYLQTAKVAVFDKQVFICMGCGKQLSLRGEVVEDGAVDWLPPEQLARLMRI